MIQPIDLTPNSITPDHLLQVLGPDLYNLIRYLAEASTYQSLADLESSQLLGKIKLTLPIVINELDALQNGSRLDKEAFDSASTLLALITTSQDQGAPSLLSACEETGNDDAAEVIFDLNRLGKLNSPNGIVGQMQILFNTYINPSKI